MSNGSEAGDGEMLTIDDRLRGFIVRVNANGTKTAMLRYRREGRNRAYKLGVIGEAFTVAQARRDAAEARPSSMRGATPERAGLDGLRLHDAPHSVASDMLADGMTLAEIAVVLGHKSTQTTTRYAHWADEGRQDIARRMGAAVERRSREGAERLQQQRQCAAGDEQGAASVRGADVAPVDGAKVIRFPGRHRQ